MPLSAPSKWIDLWSGEIEPGGGHHEFTVKKA
eukprot:CAMPEP_0171842356 /NCGR_PEP_ID=MMETSP0992-20121227/15147_1 /TAXON_ID=483369 /ORGANISM="non described non described, Strain CCMP2098" /LENGTH=31 /DNA_ID= /DNA_START= /DNA_END= /DNA_ORIENTATION=